jgi:hypothetical protein
MKQPHEKRIEYQRRIFSTRQIRDCVEGSDAIKRSGELYLPMPSGMRDLVYNDLPNTKSSNNLANDDLNISNAPWYHRNPAYTAYVMRAKFPDMTSSTLQGLLGVATTEPPHLNLPTELQYLENIATIDGIHLEELYEHCLSEVLQTGRIALVVDIRSDNTLYIADYSSESYINWDFAVIDGKRVQTYAEFETVSYDSENGEEKKSLCYSLEENPDTQRLACFVRKFKNGVMMEETIITYKGKEIDFIPVVNINSKASNNSPVPGSIPLLGVSDCSLDVYRHSADLNQNQYMSCNPTLVFFGVDADEAPKTIGSTVAICISDSSATGKYLSTDTTALSHVQSYIQDVFEEAVRYGASLLGPTKRAAESAEALSLRKASSGATLATVVTSTSNGINNAISICQKMRGVANPDSRDYFIGNKAFAEITLSAQEITALLNSWMSGAISHMTLLENFSEAGKLSNRTPDEEMTQIEREIPVIPDATTPPQEGDDDED